MWGLFHGTERNAGLFHGMNKCDDRTINLIYIRDRIHIDMYPAILVLINRILTRNEELYR